MYTATFQFSSSCCFFSKLFRPHDYVLYFTSCCRSPEKQTNEQLPLLIWIFYMWPSCSTSQLSGGLLVLLWIQLNVSNHKYEGFTFAPWLASTSHSPLVNVTSSLTTHLKSSGEREDKWRS